MKQIICTVDYFVVQITMYNLFQEIVTILSNTQELEKKCLLLLQNSILFLNFVTLILLERKDQLDFPISLCPTLFRNETSCRPNFVALNSDGFRCLLIMLFPSINRKKRHR